MLAIGYSTATAWVFPAIIDTAVATSALMLVALGDKPAPHARTPASATAEVKASAPTAPSAPPRPRSVRADQVAADSAPVDPALPAASALDQHADAGADHAALAQALVDAGATTKPAAVVASILSAHADGTARNRIASDTGIHHQTVRKTSTPLKIIAGTSSRCNGHAVVGARGRLVVGQFDLDAPRHRCATRLIRQAAPERIVASNYPDYPECGAELRLAG